MPLSHSSKLVSFNIHTCPCL